LPRFVAWPRTVRLVTVDPPTLANRITAERIRRAPTVVVTELARTPLVLSIVEPLEIGRDCAGLILFDAQISRRHLVVRPTAGGVVVADLGSLNGSTVNGERLGDRHQLGSDEVVRFGSCTLALVAPGQTTASSATETAFGLVGDPRATSIGRVAIDVLDHGPSVSQPGDPGTVTIVFTDIEGSTARAVELGDVKWFEVLSVHNQIVRSMLARHQGTETHSLGDGFMMCFRSARSAVAFVVDAQRALRAYEVANPAAGLRIRAGIHTGEAVQADDGDLFGRHVVIAARIADQARGGEVLVSSLVREIIEPRGDVTFAESRSSTLKGLSGVHLLHAITF
jgi:adenylate cyclase